jgi:hypothetical protein
MWIECILAFFYLETAAVSIRKWAFATATVTWIVFLLVEAALAGKISDLGIAALFVMPISLAIYALTVSRHRRRAIMGTTLCFVLSGVLHLVVFGLVMDGGIDPLHLITLGITMYSYVFIGLDGWVKITLQSACAPKVKKTSN